MSEKKIKKEQRSYDRCKGNGRGEECSVQAV